jgi:hypothetical protein
VPESADEGFCASEAGCKNPDLALVMMVLGGMWAALVYASVACTSVELGVISLCMAAQ